MNALVHFRDVSKLFGNAFAVRDVNLDVERGKTTVLIGPSGCGKSTLLRLIIGLLGRTPAQIEFEGAPIAPADNMKIAPASRLRHSGRRFISASDRARTMYF